MLTIEQIKFKSSINQQIKDLEESITTITTLQTSLDTLTDSEEAGNLLDKALRPIRTKILDLRVVLEGLETERVSNEVYHDSNYFDTGE